MPRQGSGFPSRKAMVFLLLAALGVLAWRLWGAGALGLPEAALLLAAALLAALQARAPIKAAAALTRLAEDLAQGRHQARLFPPPAGDLAKLGASLNRLAERIDADFSRLRRLNQVRKDFVANVSHELRTPLASIKAFSETLLAGAVEDREHALEFVREIEKSADRMSRLVDDLLELSALESGNIKPARDPVSLLKLLSEVAAALMPLAQKKRIVLRVEPFRDVPEIPGDKGQLKQVFINLIDNAIKYTGESGLIRVWASQENGKVSVSIQDSGCGIPAEDLPRIFERFYRVDKARSRELGGTGLGLAIVKHIAEAHGGSVSVESRTGEGSTFRVELPLAS